MKNLKVKCPNCKRTDFITTAKYDPNVSPRGDMLKCLLPYHIDFLLTSTTGVSSLTCPECCAQLAPSGRLVVIESIEQMKSRCPWIPPILPANKEGTVPLEADETAIADQVQVEYQTPRLAARAAKIVRDNAEVLVTVFPCTICGKPFETARKLQGHKGGAHKAKGKKKGKK